MYNSVLHQNNMVTILFYCDKIIKITAVNVWHIAIDSWPFWFEDIFLLIIKDGHDDYSSFIFCLLQVLQSFKIMDYSLLLGVHNLDIAARERVSHLDSYFPISQFANFFCYKSIYYIPYVGVYIKTLILLKPKCFILLKPKCFILLKPMCFLLLKPKSVPPTLTYLTPNHAMLLSWCTYTLL